MHDKKNRVRRRLCQYSTQAALKITISANALSHTDGLLSAAAQTRRGYRTRDNNPNKCNVDCGERRHRH